MKIICASCNKKFYVKEPLINLCNKCSKKATKLLRKMVNDNSSYCAFKYTCSRSSYFGKCEKCK